jgi:predicted AAA+ superfamily ATPase
MNGRVNIERELYTEQLKRFVGRDMIKVITGIRRSGKSALLELFQRDLLEITDSGHIIYINFEDADHEHLKDRTKLHEYVVSRMTDGGTYYLLLDEIQEADEWEKCVNSLRLRNTDIYITGSNSKLLSSELSTLLAGRYVQFRLHTLSFTEFMRFRKEYGIGSGDADEELDAYIRIGGFPALSTSAYDHRTARKVISDISDSTVFRDIVEKNRIRNVQMLRKIISFVYDNIGNVISAGKIRDFLKGQYRTADLETVYNYLQYLEDAMIIHKVQRYDIKGKRLMETFEKYYLAEHSLQYAVREYNQKNLPGILENIVYLELLRRGYDVNIGRFGDKEVDFVANGQDGKLYAQVCYLLSDKDTTEREAAPLKSIRDNYPKLIVTMDRHWQFDDEGIRGIGLKDFLLYDQRLFP